MVIPMKALLACVVLLIVMRPADAADWPQWMGPNRDNVWSEEGIIKEFPPDGPKVLWRTPVAGGYAGPAVSNGSVIVTDYQTGDDVQVANFERKSFTGIERVLCLEADSGRIRWKHEYPVRYSISYPGGPRCTPNVDDGLVYTLGAEGNLTCLDLQSGEVVWSKDFQADYNAKTSLWGYASHPLIDDNRLICVVGGEGSHAVAFDKKTGAELWRTITAADQGYSPPTIIEAAGRRQLILVRPDGISSVDPDSGHAFWSVPYEATNGSIIMSPIRSDEFLYVGGYSNKNLLMRLGSDRPSATVVWRDLKKKAISPVNVQPFLEDNVLFGMGQDGSFLAMDVATGDRLWQTGWPIADRRQQTGTAFIVKQADRFWLFNELGELVIARLTKERYEELSRAKVIEPTSVAFGRQVVWSAPAFASKRAYIRNDKECICVDLAE